MSSSNKTIGSERFIESNCALPSGQHRYVGRASKLRLRLAFNEASLLRARPRIESGRGRRGVGKSNISGGLFVDEDGEPNGGGGGTTRGRILWEPLELCSSFLLSKRLGQWKIECELDELCFQQSGLGLRVISRVIKPSSSYWSSLSGDITRGYFDNSSPSNFARSISRRANLCKILGGDNETTTETIKAKSMESERAHENDDDDELCGFVVNVATTASVGDLNWKDTATGVGVTSDIATSNVDRIRTLARKPPRNGMFQFVERNNSSNCNRPIESTSFDSSGQRGAKKATMETIVPTSAIASQSATPTTNRAPNTATGSPDELNEANANAKALREPNEADGDMHPTDVEVLYILLEKHSYNNGSLVINGSDNKRGGANSSSCLLALIKIDVVNRWIQLKPDLEELICVNCDSILNGIKLPPLSQQLLKRDASSALLKPPLSSSSLCGSERFGDERVVVASGAEISAAGAAAAVGCSVREATIDMKSSSEFVETRDICGAGLEKQRQEKMAYQSVGAPAIGVEEEKAREAEGASGAASSLSGGEQLSGTADGRSETSAAAAAAAAAATRSLSAHNNKRAIQRPLLYRLQLAVEEGAGADPSSDKSSGVSEAVIEQRLNLVYEHLAPLLISEGHKKAPEMISDLSGARTRNKLAVEQETPPMLGRVIRGGALDALAVKSGRESVARFSRTEGIRSSELAASPPKAFGGFMSPVGGRALVCLQLDIHFANKFACPNLYVKYKIFANTPDDSKWQLRRSGVAGARQCRCRASRSCRSPKRQLPLGTPQRSKAEQSSQVASGGAFESSMQIRIAASGADENQSCDTIEAEHDANEIEIKSAKSASLARGRDNTRFSYDNSSHDEKKKVAQLSHSSTNVDALAPPPPPPHPPPPPPPPPAAAPVADRIATATRPAVEKALSFADDNATLCDGDPDRLGVVASGGASRTGDGGGEETIVEVSEEGEASLWKEKARRPRRRSERAREKPSAMSTKPEEEPEGLPDLRHSSIWSKRATNEQKVSQSASSSTDCAHCCDGHASGGDEDDGDDEMNLLLESSTITSHPNSKGLFHFACVEQLVIEFQRCGSKQQQEDRPAVLANKRINGVCADGCQDDDECLSSQSRDLDDRSRLPRRHIQPVKSSRRPTALLESSSGIPGLEPQTRVDSLPTRTPTSRRPLEEPDQAMVLNLGQMPAERSRSLAANRNSGQLEEPLAKLRVPNEPTPDLVHQEKVDGRRDTIVALEQNGATMGLAAEKSRQGFIESPTGALVLEQPFENKSTGDEHKEVSRDLPANSLEMSTKNLVSLSIDGNQTAESKNNNNKYHNTNNNNNNNKEPTKRYLTTGSSRDENLNNIDDCEIILLLEFYSSDFYRDKLQGWSYLSIPVCLDQSSSSTLSRSNVATVLANSNTTKRADEYDDYRRQDNTDDDGQDEDDGSKINRFDPVSDGNCFGGGCSGARYDLPVIKPQLYSMLDQLRYFLVGQLPKSSSNLKDVSKLIRFK